MDLVGGRGGEFGGVVIGLVGCKLVIETVAVCALQSARLYDCSDGEVRDVRRISESVHCFDDASIFFLSMTCTPKDVTLGSEDNAMRWKLFALFGSKNILGA